MSREYSSGFRIADWLVLAAFVVGCLAVGWIGSLFTAPQIDTWYADIEKPAFTPPGAVFGPVWTILYAVMGVAAWLVWRRRHVAAVGIPLALFAGQLALNFAWSPVFFGMENPAAGLAIIIPLWFAIVATIAAFAPVQRWAAALLVPYLAWVTFATALNFEIWRLN